MEKAKGEFQNTALVTGASEGIGLAFAEILAGKGHDLVLVARNEEKLKQVSNDLSGAHGISAHVIVKDLSKPGAVDELWEEIQRDGIKVSVLINNAGYVLHGPFQKLDIDEQLDMVQVLVISPTRLMNYCIKEMLKDKRGKILNVSSTSAYTPCPTFSLYGASKAYMLMASQAIAHEIQSKNVSVTSLCPGATLSQFFVRSKTDKSLATRIFPMEPKDVALAGYEGMMKNKSRVTPGFINKFIYVFTRFMPTPVSAEFARIWMQ